MILISKRSMLDVRVDIYPIATKILGFKSGFLRITEYFLNAIISVETFGSVDVRSLRTKRPCYMPLS
jgi:hypothetical protein